MPPRWFSSHGVVQGISTTSFGRLRQQLWGCVRIRFKTPAGETAAHLSAFPEMDPNASPFQLLPQKPTYVDGFGAGSFDTKNNLFYVDGRGFRAVRLIRREPHTYPVQHAKEKGRGRLKGGCAPVVEATRAGQRMKGMTWIYC